MTRKQSARSNSHDLILIFLYILIILTHTEQNIKKDVGSIFYISLQLKYWRNIFVKYCKIFHRSITISTFSNIFGNLIFGIFNTFRNIVEIFRWNVPILHTSIIFPNVCKWRRNIILFYIIFLRWYLEMLFNSEKRESYIDS